MPACSISHENRRVLVIDDNRAIHEDFHKVLCNSPAEDAEDMNALEAELFGHRTSTPRSSFLLDSAFQGQEGLELIKKARASENPYAMAFVDVRMPPGWDGIETTARIWEIDPDLQIVICTAYSDYSWDQMFQKLGQSDRLVILKKPFDQVEVLQLATSLTRKWQLLQQSKNQLADLESIIALRSHQVIQEQEKLKAIFDNSPEGIFQITPAARLLSANPSLAKICGYSSATEMVSSSTDFLAQMGVDPARRRELLDHLAQQNSVRDFEVEITTCDAARKWISITAAKVAAKDCIQLFYQGFVLDITTQKAAEKDQQLMEAHLRQAQKLESVGHLAAGIAHEINTPIQYIGDNVRFVKDAFTDVTSLLQKYHSLQAAVEAGAVSPQLLAELHAACEKIDLDYLQAEVPGAIHQTLEGLNQVSRIVLAMKEFSHPGKTEKVPVDLNHAIETTITVARNEWKYVADVVTDFAPDLPAVQCLPGDLNQVFLNLLVNAAHTIGDVVKDTPGTKGTIRISTKDIGQWIEIRVSDTGAGIPESIRHRIFEPFFTTKPVGKGTGQGLALAHATIVKKHGGELSFESEVAKGTTFIIHLPK